MSPKEELRNLLINLEESTRISNIKVQEAFNELALNLFALNFNYQSCNFQIAEIEFASSRLKDTFHCHDQQLTLGRTYVHKAKNIQNFAGFDITCGKGGPEGSYGAILVKAIRHNGVYIDGPNLALRAIIGITEGRTKLPDEELKKFSEFNNLDIFEMFTISRAENTQDVENHFQIGERITIVGKKSETKEEKSGALLRATVLPEPKAKKRLLSIHYFEDHLQDDEEDVFEEVIDIVPVPRFKEKPSKDYKIAESRYNSLIERTFKKKLESFLFIKAYVQKEEALTLEDFKEFMFTSELEEQMLHDYKNVSVLRAKNKLFKSLTKSYKDLFKDIKNHIKSEFNQQLDKEMFLSKFFFQDDERSKRICGYCGVNEEEIFKLFQKSQIYTKRQYSRGQTLEVDKIDPNDHYRIGNIILACYWCNNAKTDEFTDEEFSSVGKAIKAVWDKRLKV